MSSANNAYAAPEAYLKIGDIKGEAKGSEKVNGIADETSTKRWY